MDPTHSISTPDQLLNNLDQGLARLRDQGELQPLLPVLAEAGAFFVGGLVRDLCLSREIQDVDLIVPSRSDELCRRLRPRKGGAIVPLDPARGIYRLVLRPDLYLDIANFQGPGVLEDLGVRDFTVNAMAVPVAGRAVDLLDPHQGLVDLAGRRLRMVAAENLISDPLRVLRAARLGARLDLELDSATHDAMGRAASGLAHVAMERIHAELEMLLEAERALPWVQELSRLQAFGPILSRPGFGASPRDPARSVESGRSELGITASVWSAAHGGEVTAGAGLVPPGEACLPLLWAALAHDLVGSRLTLREAADLFTNFRIPTRIGRRAAHIYIGPAQLRGPKDPREMMQELLTLGESIHETLILAQALGLPFAERALTLYRDQIARLHGAAPLVSGGELVEAGLKPGPRLGKLIQEIELRRRLGELQTRDDALKWATEANKNPAGDAS